MTPANEKHAHVPAAVSLISGGIAGGVEAAVTYPFEFVKTRVQLRAEKGVKSPRNPFKIVRQVYVNEGLRSLYKGCPALAAGSVAKDAIRFFSFDAVKNTFRDESTGAMTLGRNMAAGAAAGIVASIFAVTPTERIKTALIDDARSEKRFTSSLQAVSLIVKEDGLVGLYRGFAGTTLKQASASACRLGFYNTLKSYESARNIEQNTIMNFVNGAISGTLTTLATQPFDTIKTVSQSARRTTTMQAVRAIMVDDGIKGFWKGTVMRLGRTILAGGVLFTTAEAVHNILTPLFAVVPLADDSRAK